MTPIWSMWPERSVKMVEVFLYEDADAVLGSRFMAGDTNTRFFFGMSWETDCSFPVRSGLQDVNLTDIKVLFFL